MIGRYVMTLNYARAFQSPDGFTDRGEQNIEVMAESSAQALTEAVKHFGGVEPDRITISRQREVLVPDSLLKHLGIGTQRKQIERKPK